MEVFLYGPICKDENQYRGDVHHQLGGVLLYAGNALSSLGVDVTLVATYGDELEGELSDFRSKEIIPIDAEGTIKFKNIYPDANPNHRIQLANTPQNEITFDHVEGLDFERADYHILGPLFHDNISPSLIAELKKRNCPIVSLSPQGMIRYKQKDTIVLRHPENVLKVLPDLDYMFLDDKELKFISGTSNVPLGVKYLQEKGLENVLVTHGDMGSDLFLGRDYYPTPAFKVKEEDVADPTGAGDSYMAGFIRALELFPHQPVLQGEFAAMTATMAIKTIGPLKSSLIDVYHNLRRYSKNSLFYWFSDFGGFEKLS